jgi:hypothetical protein
MPCAGHCTSDWHSACAPRHEHAEGAVGVVQRMEQVLAHVCTAAARVCQVLLLS